MDSKITPPPPGAHSRAQPALLRTLLHTPINIQSPQPSSLIAAYKPTISPIPFPKSPSPQLMLTYTLTVGSICGATSTVFPSNVPVFSLLFPATLSLSGLRLFDTTSAGSDCASRLTSISAPSRTPVLELELPALLAERGETLLETTSTGL